MTKKLISLLLCAAMLLCLGACGSTAKEATAPETSTVKADVQSYLTDSVDPAATITVFEITADELDGENYSAIATAYYDVNGTSSNANFTCIYKLEGEEWALQSVTSDAAAPSAAPAEATAAPAASAEEPAAQTEAPAEQTEAPAEETAAPASAATMSDNLLDCTFTLNGVVYQLPFAYTDFTANGWTISYGGFETDEVDGNSYSYLTMVNSGNQVTVYVVNLSGNTKAIKDCNIGGIEVETCDVQSPDYFTIAKGINAGSTQEEVEAAFGTANDLDSNDDATTLRYKNDSDSYNYARFYYYADNADYNEIELRNFGEAEETATDETVPDYLASYVAPTELGDDILSGNVLIDGDLYRVACPVSAFTDNGWTVSSKSGAVAAGDRDYIELTRDGKEISLTVTNFAKYQTIPENCAVTEIDVYSFDEVTMQLAGGLAIGSTADEAKAFATTDDWSISEGDYVSYYSPWDSDEDYELFISFDDETGNVETIYLTRNNWDY